ncbi:MAG: AraC family transcriptional regulator [Bacteroidales bacterium]|nr:AraC family transcriptional regulator [Bacteroidales bacterium]
MVGVGSAVLAILLMLIKIPNSAYSGKLATSKLAIVVSFLICSFMMFYTISEYGSEDIWDWEMFTMLTIYIVVHFSTCIISYSMLALLKTERHKGQNLFMPGLLVSAIVAFMLLESYKSQNMRYFGVVCLIAVIAFLIQTVTYIVYFDKAYKQSLMDLENYYDEDESHKIKWVRFCYIISMLTNVFFLVYLCLFWFLDYKMEIAALYTFWYLLYFLYLTSNFLSFLSTHKLVLDAVAHKVLTGQDLNLPIGGEARKARRNRRNQPDEATHKETEFRKIEKAIETWVEQKRFCEYDRSRDEIARELGTSTEMLHVYFNTKVGVDFKTWRTELRIAEAKRILLENREISTSVVGEISGFSDRSNFHRQFVKFVGCSPKQWRDSDGRLG